MSIQGNRLRPNDSVQKLLFSTTSKLNGEYESENFLITHAWNYPSPNSSRNREQEGPASRNAYVASFRTESWREKNDLVIPDYSGAGELICSFLAVLYGKRFDSHGLTEGSGFYRLPDLSHYNQICDHRLPFNSHKPRANLPVELSLNCISAIEMIFFSSKIDKALMAKLKAACKFYLQALQNAEDQPEISYLHLITAAEVISAHFEFSDEDLIDEVMRKDLAQIEHGLSNGKNVARRIRKRHLSIKRRVVLSVSDLIDPEFFEKSEANDPWHAISADGFKERISAAYDLRSKYVHTGVPFGNWVAPRSQVEEVHAGKPVVEDRNYGKILAKAPMFLGLERVVRYCILKFMAANGFEKLKSSAIAA